MHILVTGASGFIGSAVVPELLGAGHQVTGLARSDAAAETVSATGAEVRRGSLDDPDSLRAAAAGVDAVVHLAFKHDIAFSGDYEGAAAADRRAIDTFGEVLAPSGGALVIAGGTALLGPDRVVTEQDVAPADHPMRARADNEDAALGLAARGVRASTVRLSPTVHGPGDQGFVAMIVAAARERGASAYVGDGSQRWPAVHRLDAARLFRLAVEQAPAGTVLHGVADEGVPFRSIAETIGRHLGVPVTSLTPEQAFEHAGFVGMLMASDIPASSALTRELLGWEPTHPGLLADLDEGHYFA